MRFCTLLAILLSACASVPRGAEDHETRAVFEGYTVERVRAASIATLDDLARFMSPVRVTEDGSVVSEYAASGWTSYEIGFEALDDAVLATVRIEPQPQPSCPGRSSRRVSAIQLAAARAPDGNGAEGYQHSTPLLPRVAHQTPSCAFRTRDVRIDRGREILDQIRARLESSR